jgi:GNAT superfamily N-acetyltransferase
MVFESEREHGPQWAAIVSIASTIGCTAETLRTWVRRVEVDTGRRGGVTSDDRVRIKEFLKYAAPDALAERAKGASTVFVAEDGGRIAGVLELRGPDRIALFFVDAPGRGIGRRLIEEALELCRQGCPDLEAVTVHSSRHAVPVYRHFGFEPTGDERTEDGITYLPMEYRFERAGMIGS